MNALKTLAAIFLLAAASLTTAQADVPVTNPPAASTSALSTTHTERLPGVDLAEGISQITGTAISPLLGVSSVGAWRYYHTSGTMRERLPWFCHPLAWRFGFALLGLCFFKDFFGTIAPPFLKKPLDMIELFENKLSALVASAAFVPFIAAQMAQQIPPPSQSSLATSGLNYASMLPLGSTSLEVRPLLIPFCILSFLVVWMTCHAINVLIALCPFGFIDALLKLCKSLLLSAIVLCSLINPYLGAALSVIIIAIAAYLAPAAFRLTLFGTLFATDTLLPWRGKRLATPAEPHAFVSFRASGVATRTFGRIVRGPDGAVHFRYRPWLILPRRSIPLPKGAFAISRGILFPSLLYRENGADGYAEVIAFLPRYRTFASEIAGHLEIVDVRDGSIASGFKAIRAWFVETLGLEKPRESHLPHAQVV